MKAQQYNLAFKVASTSNERIPLVECGIDSQGNSINVELASFIESGGVDYTIQVMDEVSGLNFGQSANNGFVHEFPAYSNEYVAEFFASPSRASFWNGSGYTEIPIQDFVDILQEWIDFLNSLPFDHVLSNR